MRPAATGESASIGYCRNTSSILTNVFQYLEHALIWFVLWEFLLFISPAAKYEPMSPTPALIATNSNLRSMAGETETESGSEADTGISVR